ncbi:DUF3307 domain-containing protein [Streptomyces sp. NPDC056491]|uniref:DUF3307 domain-containing protein n=1 Tax=Streptomyces sp. NPDC056491 TaxID=3345837 RepID=UPI0036899A62
MFATLFVLLFVSHLLSDYPFQTDHQASHKAARTATGWIANGVHAGTHVVTTAAALLLGWAALDLSLSLPVAAAGLLWIGVSHSFIDRRWAVAWWMQHTGQQEFVKHGGAAHVDQAAHMGALLLASLGMAAATI